MPTPGFPLRSRFRGAPWTARSARNRKRERDTWPDVRLGPEAAMVSLDDRVTDRQPDSHSIGLGCIECFKELVLGLRSETDSRIYHAKTHAITLLPFGFDHQLSQAVINTNHRVASVS